MFKMLKEFVQKMKERRLNALKSRLGFVQEQIRQVLKEDSLLREIATKCARDMSGPDETRSLRMSARSTMLLYNSQLLVQLGAEERLLKKKLGMQ